MNTTFAPSAFAELDKISTPNFDAAGEWNYQDADDELALIAKFLASKASHESEIDPSRIKFFYTNKVKKDGGKFIIGTLSAIDELDLKNKAIQLDKILCGVQLAPGKDQAEVVVKKKPTDSREYSENMKHFGELEVLKSSEIVNMAVERILEDAAEEKKLKKEQKAAKNKKSDE